MFNNSLIIWFHFEKETPKPLPVVPESVVEKPSEKPVIAGEPESVITNGGKLGGVKLFFWILHITLTIIFYR